MYVTKGQKFRTLVQTTLKSLDYCCRLQTKLSGTTNFVMSHTLQTLQTSQTSLFLNLVNLEKLTRGKNA